MAEHGTTTEAGTDGDGLVLQKYEAMVLVVVPPRDFEEQTLRHARSSLANVRVGTRSVSTVPDVLIHGRLQDEFMVDGPLAEARLEGYAGVIFVGGEGALELADDADALRLASEAAERRLLIGAWGHSVAILAAAGVLRRRRVTGAPAVADAVRRAGARFTGRQLEVDRNLVTATDAAVGIRFGKALAQIVGI
jgi:putative intracellular protease/amidase